MISLKFAFINEQCRAQSASLVHGHSLCFKWASRLHKFSYWKLFGNFLKFTGNQQPIFVSSYMFQNK